MVSIPTKKKVFRMTGSAKSPGIRLEIAALKRSRILVAAAELFYAQGYEHTTLDAVGERLGVTKPFIYAHFSSKTEILAEICAQGIGKSLEAIDGVLSLDLPPVEKLEELCRRFVEAVLVSQMHIAIFTREEKHLAHEDYLRISNMRRDFDRKLRQLLEEGAAQGVFSIRDPRMAALSIGGMVSWAYVWYRPKGRLQLNEVAEEMTRLILAMVGGSARQAG